MSSDGINVTTEIHRALRMLFEESCVVELRILHTEHGTVSGYFDNLASLAQTAAQYSGRVPGVYVTLNPVSSSLLSRARNKTLKYARLTTADSDVTARRWLPIDFDPVRPSGISSSEVEHETAIHRAVSCRDWLSEKGMPEPIVADSGNGAHLLYRIDLENSRESLELVRNVLRALDIRFSDDRVKVDLTTCNAARIWKLYGTIAAKGDNTSERPHRAAKVLSAPDHIEPVNTVLLTELASQVPQPVCRGGASTRSFDLDRWIRENALPVVDECEWGVGGRRWVLNPCPWNPEHTNKAAYIVQLPNGAIAAGCHHNGCADKDWSSLRSLYEPDHGTAIKRRGRERPETAKQKLLDLCRDLELYCGADGDGFATCRINDHNENWPIRSKEFTQLLSAAFYRATGDAPTTQAIQETKNVLECKARVEGKIEKLNLRIAGVGNRVYLDLCSSNWEVVEIDDLGWRIVSNPPVKFRRSKGMLPIPTPVSGGSIKDIRRFLNIGTEEDWILMAAWLIGALSPSGPYPLLVLHGEQGSAKSTSAKIVKTVIDPGIAAARAEPRDVGELMISARNSWVLALDNLSYIPDWLSDSLCRLSTGGGFVKRELYTDTDEVLLEAQRPIILNGIDELATRSDLLDRAIVVYLPPIEGKKRQQERVFWADFEEARPLILGAALDVVSSILRNIKSVTVNELPRLADFAIWATAAEPAMNWAHGKFLEVYTDNSDAAIDIALGASPIVEPLLKLVNESDWEGTATELLEWLNLHAADHVRRQRSWPMHASRLSNMLRRVVPNLRRRGVMIEFKKANDRSRQRKIAITRQADFVAIGETAPF